MLTNKTVVITGATGGIGKSISFLFAKNNAKLILLGKNYKKLKTLKSNILKKYKKTKIHLVDFDISNFDQVKNSFEKITKFVKKVDVLVNNAGILKDSLIGMISQKELTEIYNTNLLGPILLTQLITKLMVKKNCSIVNIASIVGIKGNIGQSSYSSSKSGMIGFTLTAAKELANRSIRVNAVSPGLINTPMIKNIPNAKLEQIVKSIKFNRIGTPNDIANVCLFFSSDYSNYVTGQVLAVDGGLII
jgi:3-oxoacyl-[acyl-carrier protein] reductase